jgi:hypothetical protein
MGNDSFDMGSAYIPGNKTAKEKLKPGTHVVIVQDVKEHTGLQGKGFIVEFTVESGPSAAGLRADFKVYPHDAKGGGRMPRDSAYQRELGKIKRTVAAICGLEAGDANQIDNVRYQSAISRPVSPLKGRRVVVEAVPWTNKEGNPTVFYEFYPHSANEPATAEPVKAKPALPTRAAVVKTLANELVAQGFQVHPDDSSFVFNEATSECIELAEFKARFGVSA